MKKKVLCLALSLALGFTAFVGPVPAVNALAQETQVSPAAEYSVGAETAVNAGAGAIVETNEDIVNAFKNLEDFTMNATFQVTGTSAVQTLFFIGDSTKSRNYISVWVSGTGNKVGVESYNSSGSSVISQNNKTSSVEFCDGEEHRFTYRHEKTGNLTFYIDGEVVFETTAGAGFTEGLFADDAAMYLGMGNGNRASGGNNYPMTGALKDVQIFDSALSAEQIAAYHTVPEDYENLVFKAENFAIDGTQGATVTDTNVDLLKALDTGVISICYRVDSADAQKTTLFALTDADARQCFEVFVNPAYNTIGVMIKGTDTTQNIEGDHPFSEGVEIHDTQWHVVTIRKNSAAAGAVSYDLFIDGTRLNSDIVEDEFLSSITDADTISIGSLKADSSDENVLAGAIDSVRVYSGNLTDSQISALAEHLQYEAETIDDMTNATKTEAEYLYYSGYDGSTAYRIPSLLKTKDGTVLAAIDQRNTGSSDSGNIDLMIRRREEGETSFEEGIDVIDLIDNNGSTPCAFMIDSCMVQDQNTGRIFMVADMFPESSGLLNSSIIAAGSGYEEIDGEFYQVVYQGDEKFGTIRENGVVYDTNNEKTEYTVITECEAPYKELGNLYKNGDYVGNVYMFSGTDQGELHILRTHYLWLTYSDDDGKTWANPKDITPQVKEDWMLFIGDGPGVGLQLQDGTLTFPVYSASRQVAGSQSSALIYSTDGGETWTLGESPVKFSGTDREQLNNTAQVLTESQAIQLETTGEVKLFMRNLSGRVKVATSSDGGKTWDKIESTPIYDCYCQLSVVNYVKDGVEYVVMSNPGAAGRNVGTINMGIVQEDGSINWTYSKVLESGAYCYSCLTKLGFDEEGDMQFGVLYETYDENNNLRIHYVEIDEQWIKNGTTTSTQEAPKVVDKEIVRNGDTITIGLTFDQVVMAAGEAGLKWNLSGTEGMALYKEGSGTDTLIFEGTIPSGNGALKVTGIDTSEGYLENVLNEEPQNVKFDVLQLNELTFVDATATSQHSSSTAENTDGAAVNVIDGNPNTYWHSTWGDSSITLPQSITMELAKVKTIYKFVYTPRQSSSSARIKNYELSVSTDGENFTVVHTGTFSGGSADETVEFVPVEAKYVRLTALTATVSGSCNMAEGKVYEYVEGVYEVADTTKLQEELAAAQAILASENSYSKATLEALESVVAQVDENIDREISTALAENYLLALQKAEAALVDTTRGMDAVANAEAILNNGKVYTEESGERLEGVIADAKENLKRAADSSDVTDVVMKLNYEVTLLEAIEVSTPVTKIFTDIAEGSWYEDAVQYVYDKGLMEGNGDKFTPNGQMTRGMFVTTLYRLAGEPEVTDRSACTELHDVAENAWYTDAVCWAYANGITTGYENDRTFRTNVALSREQLATFVYRYADYQKLDVSASDDLEGLLNADKVKPYAAKEVKWAVGAGIINGMEIKDEAGNVAYDLAPQKTATRAQMAQILMNFCETYHI